MRIGIIIIAVVVTQIGCGKKDTKPEAQAFAVMASCKEEAKGTFDFQEWGKEDATSYKCDEFEKMDCQFAVGANHSEFLCQGNDQVHPNGKPDGCELYAESGDRTFLNGVTTKADAYDCGYRYNELRCFYFVHKPDSDNSSYLEDFKCI